MGRSKGYNDVDWFKVSRSIVDGGCSVLVRRQALRMLDVLADIGNNGEDRLSANGRMDVDYGSVSDVRWLLLWGLGAVEVREMLSDVKKKDIMIDALELVGSLVSEFELDEEDVPVEDMRRRMVEEHWGLLAGTYGWSVVSYCDWFSYEELDRRARMAVEAGTPYIRQSVVRDAYASCC